MKINPSRMAMCPKSWHEKQKGQKDTDAGWMKKNGLNHFGDQNHLDIDVKHKLIRRDEVRPASVHDSNVLEELVDENNSRKDDHFPDHTGPSARQQLI
ncbi:MAG: transposase [Candidatus Poribacteria bacterium]|nr:transposase [Candidatus Poribacteria bacterium]MDP6997744.1 transposase [Candidatus Poribacteria bacterium]